VSSLTILRAEIYKELIETRRYTFNLAVSIVIQTVIFLGILFLAIGFSPIGVGASVDVHLAKSFLIVGYTFWTLAMLAINNMGQDITTEMTTGTFEQKYMAYGSPVIVLAGRALGNIVVSLVYVAVLLPVLMLVTGVRVQVPWTVAPVLALTLVGLYGLGYILAGMALVFKRIGQVAYGIQLLLLFFGGFADPDRVGAGLATFGRMLPLTAGVEAARELIIRGSGLDRLIADGTLCDLCVNSAVYLAAGLAAFCVCDRIARSRGLLGKY